MKKSLTGFHLKMIAVISMLIDHTAATVVERMMQYPDGFWANMNLYWLYETMRCIGRLAFPIYCFLLVEGYRHTHNVKKYALRLGVFALISEVPFDLAFQHAIVDFSYNNVFFTLLFGLVGLAGMDWIEDFTLKKNAKNARLYSALMSIGWIALLCALSMLCRVDYYIVGILVILILHKYYERPVLGFGWAVVILALCCGWNELWALSMILPIAMYNGERGKQVRYFFYGFYPGHLAVLDLVCVLLGLPLLEIM